MKKKILITMLEIGNGHKAPANAIKKSIEKLYSEKYDVEVIDLFKEMNSNTLFWMYKTFWVDFALRFPSVFNFIYRFSNNNFTRLSEKILLLNVRRKTKSYIQDMKPDLILNTHYSCSHVFSMLKLKDKIPVIALNTDPFDAHYIWAVRNMYSHIVFSKMAKEMLINKGIEGDIIINYENKYPLDSKHSLKVDSKEIIRRRLKLENKKTILMSAGGEGVGNLKEYLVEIINSNLDYQIIFICGRNEKLKNELELIKTGNKVRLRVFGFVDNMQEFIQASDIILGKPGASQTFEVLAKNKPIVYSTYMRNEYPTLQFVVDNKIGWYVKTKEEFVELLKKIEKNPKLLRDAEIKIKKLNIKNCSDEIAEYVNGILS